MPTYRVEIAIRGLASVVIEAIAHDDESIALLGRDVLNRHNVTLFGPAQKVEIE